MVVPAHDAADTLGAQLEALAAQQTDRAYEIVVVDNGSADGTGQLARRFAATHPGTEIRVLRVERPGANGARNAGVAATDAPFILLCDADDIVDTDWVEGLATVLESCDLVGGPRRPFTDRDRLVLRTQFAVEEPPRLLNFLAYPAGASCGFRREAFDAVGGFDESYPGAGGDELEFFCRVQLAGRTMGWARAGISYRLRSTLVGEFRQLMDYHSGGARLYKRFRAVGAQRQPWSKVLRAWGSLILRPYMLLLGRTQRRDWLRQLAVRLGRLRGSLRHRTLFL